MASLFLGQFKSLQDGKDSRQSLPDRYPENVQIYVEIGVNKPVTHANNIIPGYCRYLTLGGLAHPVCSLANNFNAFDQSPGELPVRIKTLTRAIACKADNVAGCVYDMPYSDQIIRLHTAPRLLLRHGGENNGLDPRGCVNQSDAS